jgi:hypothetical protein
MLSTDAFAEVQKLGKVVQVFEAITREPPRIMDPTPALTSDAVSPIRNLFEVSNRANSWGLRQNLRGSSAPVPVFPTDMSAPPVEGVAPIDITDELAEAFADTKVLATMSPGERCRSVLGIPSSKAPELPEIMMGAGVNERVEGT